MCAHENRSGRYATAYALVKDFLEFDSISTIRISWQKTNPARRVVATAGGLPFEFTLTQCLASTIYEEKGA
jgi:hypothetical protein